jgi:hypothetical protein
MQLQRPLKRKPKKSKQVDDTEEPSLLVDDGDNVIPLPTETTDNLDLQQVQISQMTFEYIVPPIKSLSIYPSLPQEQYYSTNINFAFDNLECEPSAPALDELDDIIASDFKYSTKVSSDVDLNEYVSIEETILESVYVNPLLEKHERDVINFRQYSLGGF